MSRRADLAALLRRTFSGITPNGDLVFNVDEDDALEQALFDEALRHPDVVHRVLAHLLKERLPMWLGGRRRPVPAGWRVRARRRDPTIIVPGGLTGGTPMLSNDQLAALETKYRVTVFVKAADHSSVRCLVPLRGEIIGYQGRQAIRAPGPPCGAEWRVPEPWYHLTGPWWRCPKRKQHPKSYKFPQARTP
jgi:hypothetical protein